MAVEARGAGEGTDRRDKFKQYATGGVKNYCTTTRKGTIEAYGSCEGEVPPRPWLRPDVVRLPPFPKSKSHFPPPLSA